MKVYLNPFVDHLNLNWKNTGKMFYKPEQRLYLSTNELRARKFIKFIIEIHFSLFFTLIIPIFNFKGALLYHEKFLSCLGWITSPCLQFSCLEGRENHI